MKFDRFLSKVQELIQYGVEVDLITVKRIMDIFEQCLSHKQLERWNTELAMIKSYKSKFVQTKLN